MSRSILASVDGAHAVHPSHADRHEPQHKPVLNGGPVIKLNAMERYATTLHTDAHLDRCAESLNASRGELVRRLDNAGFGYLLADHVLAAARRRKA